MNAPSGQLSSDVNMQAAPSGATVPTSAVSVQSGDSNTDVSTHPPTPSTVYNGDFPLLTDADNVVPAAYLPHGV